MDYTRTSLFILPMLDKQEEDFPGFINTYVRDVNHPTLQEHIFVVCDKDKVPTLRIYKHPQLVEIYNVKEYKVYVHKVPEKYLSDYYLFLSGSYSKFSKDYKDCICKFYPKYVFDPKRNIVRKFINYAIIYPDKKHRNVIEASLDVKLDENAEIYSSPDIAEETFDVLKEFVDY